MSRFWVVTVMGAFGRLVAIAGAALTVGAVVAIVAEWVLVALRYTPDWNVGLLPLVLPLQVVVAGWVTWSALTREEPRRLLRNLLIAAALSFLLLYGWYFLLMGQGFELIAGGKLLYLLAGLTTLVSVLGDRALRSAEPGREEMVRGVSAVIRALGATIFGIAAIAGYASIPSPPQAQAIAAPQQPSCPEYLEEEIASLRGSDDRTSPAFETPGYWGYEYASTGYGTISVRVLAETGDVVHGADEPPFKPVAWAAATSPSGRAPSGWMSRQTTTRNTPWSSAGRRIRAPATEQALVSSRMSETSCPLRPMSRCRT